MNRRRQLSFLIACGFALSACGKSATTPTAPTAATTQTSAPATLAAPVDRATVSYFAQPLTFTFTDPAVASGRALADEAFELAAAPEFTTLLYTLQIPLTGGPTRTVTPAIPRLASGRYYWRVRSRLADAPSEVSEIRQFIVDDPAVTLPLPTENFSIPYKGRRWPMISATIPIGLAEASITQLEAQWAADPSFSTLIEDRLIAPTPAYTDYPYFRDFPETLLPAATTYWHRSRAVQPSRGKAGPWTAPWSATTPPASDAWTMWILTSCSGGFGLAGNLRDSGSTAEFRTLQPMFGGEAGFDLGADHLARSVGYPRFSVDPGVSAGLSAGPAHSLSLNQDVPLTWARSGNGFSGVASSDAEVWSSLSVVSTSSWCTYPTGRDFRWLLLPPGK